MNGYGASDLRRTDGDVLDAEGKRIAHVSFNGRLWGAERKTPLDEQP